MLNQLISCLVLGCLIYAVPSLVPETEKQTTKVNHVPPMTLLDVPSTTMPMELIRNEEDQQINSTNQTTKVNHVLPMTLLDVPSTTMPMVLIRNEEDQQINSITRIDKSTIKNRIR